jgi:putative peptide zinc metalloprotease protein
MSQASTLRYRLAPSVRTGPFDVSGKHPRYLLEVGQNRKFEVTAGVNRVVEILREGTCSVPEIVDRLREEGDEQLTPEKVTWLLQAVLVPRQIALLQGVEESAELANSRPPPGRRSFLWVQVPLIGPALVRPLAGLLSHLYHPWVALPILAVSVAVYIDFYASQLRGFRWSLSSLSALQMVMIVVALNLATVFHELGHAAACRRFGASPGKIGWGIYMFMFVLYADVSEVWRLNRRQRAVVDVGGMYFEVIATLVLFGLYWVTAAPIFVYSFVFVNLGMTRSLNPILRQDGYWLLADLAGQANLRDANLEALRFACRRLIGRKSERRPALFDKPRWLQITIFLYSAVSCVFSLGLMIWLGKRLVVDVIPTARGLAGSLLSMLASGRLETWAALSAAGRLGLAMFFVFLVGFAAWSFVASLVRPLFAGEAAEDASGQVRAEWREAP